MIGRITGNLVHKQAPDILVEVGGVGYELQVPMTTLFQLPALGSEVSLVTHFVVREDAQLLFVAMSSPMKEKFIERWKTELGVDFVMGVGGSFDVMAGVVSRAPRWMQQSGLEWFYRVLQEPRRMWKRYLVTNTQCVCWVMSLKAKQLLGQ